MTTIQNISQNGIQLQLGDVIRIVDPYDEKTNNQKFFIDYIDPYKIKLTQIDTFEPLVLKRTDEGRRLADTTIEDMVVISRSDTPSYARQNDLLPEKWVDLFFGGDLPFILTGKIVNLEEDTIEILTYPNKDTIYIHFDYKGIPDDLPLDLITVREPPTDIERKITEETGLEEGEEEEPNQPTIEQGEEGEEEKEGEGQEEEGERQEEEGQEEEGEGEYERLPPQTMTNAQREKMFKTDQIVFGDESLGPVVQMVNIQEEKKRFGIETQTQDLLDEMLSTLPNAERTNKALNSIHTMITRFIQLRKQFSLFDENGNVKGVIIKGPDWKPLVENLKTFQQSLYWLLPVVKNIKNVYDVNTNTSLSYTPDEDILLLTLKEELQKLKLDLENYKSNNVPAEQNKYYEMLNKIDEQLSPFHPYDVPDESKKAIYKTQVNTDIPALVSNQDNFETIAVMNEDKLNKKYFFMDRYITGMTKLVAERNNRLVKRSPLTSNDELTLVSLVTLPEPVVRFSRIQLPGTSILDKTNLNLHFLNYWELLRRSTPVQNKGENVPDTEFISSEKISNYMFSSFQEGESTENTNKFMSKERYQTIIGKIVPRTKSLFSLIKKYMKGKLSLVELVNFMEPFLIYTDDLTYFQYKEMKQFIYEKVSDFNKTFLQKGQLFRTLMQKNYQEYKSDVYNLVDLVSSVSLHERNKEEAMDVNVMETYKLENYKTLHQTNQELLTLMNKVDFGQLFNLAVSLSNTKLMFSQDLNIVLDDMGETWKQTLKEKSKSDTCKKYILAKRYHSLQEVTDDNNKDIYFDKAFDSTVYSTFDDYEKELVSMPYDEFHTFLIKKLEKRFKINSEEAEYLAESLLEGKKRVIDGQYALLEDEYDILYFERKGDEWIRDASIDENVFINQSNLLCNIQEKCVENTASLTFDKDCISIDSDKSMIQENNLKTILNEFDKSYTQSQEKMESELVKKMQYSLSILPKLEFIEREKRWRYNNQQYRLGLDKEVQEDQQCQAEGKGAKISPYAKLRDTILGGYDFPKKQLAILRFKNQFTREALVGIGPLGKEESLHWLYCKETNTPLLPVFLYTLATYFVNDPNNYDKNVDFLIKDIGAKSDDGDKWVDKYSGYTIKNIDLSVEEGYEEGGFRVSTRDLLQPEVSSLLLERRKGEKEVPKDKEVTRETKIIHRIISTLADNMGVHLEEQRDFITSNVVTVLQRYQASEEETSTKPVKKTTKVKGGAKKEKEKEKEEETQNQEDDKKKRESKYNEVILYCTLGMILITIQTNIPSIQTKKTFPGCLRSFSGYPFQGEGDNSSLDYMTCIVYQIRNSYAPWNVLLKKKKENIFQKLKDTVEVLLPLQEVKRKIDEKIEFLRQTSEEGGEKGQEAIPDEYSVAKWREFLPPLVPFDIKDSALDNITDAFKNKLKESLNTGSVHQRENLMIVESKIIFFSLGIQKCIQDVVSKKTLLFHNYNINACCSNKNEMTTISYFEKENSNIARYNENVKYLENLLSDIEYMTRSETLFCRENTKNKYPGLPNEFTEETIYRAFLLFCQFQTQKPIPENLISVCNEKPGFDTRKLSLVETIQKMKMDGRHYTNESFLRLLQLVNKENEINIPTTQNVLSSLEKMRNIVDSLSDTPSSFLPEELIQHLQHVLDDFDHVETGSDVARSLRNYLSSRNEAMIKQINVFVEKYKSRNIGKYKNFAEFLSKLMSWRWMDHEDETDNVEADNAFQFIKSYLDNFVSVFPNIIMNNIDYKDPLSTARRHWNLSQSHFKKVSDKVTDYYKELKLFYDAGDLNTTLSEIQTKKKGFLSLVKEIIYYKPFYNATGEKISPTFDRRTCFLLLEHLLYLLFTEYIRLSQTGEGEEHEEIEMGTGENKKVTTSTANMLLVFSQMMMEHKKIVDKSYEDIVDAVFKLKEGEKDIMTDRLNKMTEEERNADKILKNNKLGVWNKGLQRGLTKYEKSTYEDERDFIEQLHNRVKHMNPNADESNIDQYMDDYIQDLVDVADIEAEVNDISDMDEDYVDGMYDPDDIDNLADVEEDYDYE